MTKITSQPNRSYKVDGPIVIEDGSGKITPVAEGESVFLCRCGGSKNKPWCDGTHKVNDFRADK